MNRRSTAVREFWEMPRAGSLNRLRRVSGPLEAPEPGEATVRVEAIGLNFADVFACLGLYSATPKGSFVPGLEFSGVVEEIAPSGTPSGAVFKAGDRVMGLTRFGAFATRLNAGTPYLRPVPEGWDFSQGAAFGAQALTAWYAVHELGSLKEGQTALVHSAAGGVGLNAAALVLRGSACLICTVGAADKREFLRRRFSVPTSQIIVRDARRFPDQLDAALEAVGAEGFDLVLDAVAGPYFRPAYRRLSPGGRLVLFGAANLMPAGDRPNYMKLIWRYLARPRLDPLNMIAENRSLMAFNLIWLWNRYDLLAEMYDQAAQALPDPPHVGRVFEFGEAVQALRFLQSGKSVGKVILQVGESS